MIYYIFRNDIIIEELINRKRKNKSDFAKRIFIKMQEKNEKNVVAKNDVEINFIKKTSIIISKII